VLVEAPTRGGVLGVALILVAGHLPAASLEAAVLLSKVSKDIAARS
jgi:hypothetical protein